MRGGIVKLHRFQSCDSGKIPISIAQAMANETCVTAHGRSNVCRLPTDFMACDRTRRFVVPVSPSAFQASSYGHGTPAHALRISLSINDSQVPPGRSVFKLSNLPPLLDLK